MWWDMSNVTEVQTNTVMSMLFVAGNTIHSAMKIAVLTMSESNVMSKIILFR